MSSRQLLRNFVRGRPCARPPLLVAAFYHAARIDNVDFAALLRDPTRLTRALLDQQRLLGTDAVAVRFDVALFAQAAGLDVDWSAAVPAVDWSRVAEATWPPPVSAVEAAAAPLVDVVGRLTQELRRQVPVLTVLPGPVSLARAGGGENTAEDDASAVLREVADAACRAGAEAVLVEEAAAGWDDERMRERLAPITNTVAYYNAAAFVTAPKPPEGKLGDAVVLPAGTAPGSVSDSLRVGFTVPVRCFEDDDALRAFAAGVAGRTAPAFLTANDATLTSHPVERNVAVLSALHDLTYG